MPENWQGRSVVDKWIMAMTSIEHSALDGANKALFQFLGEA